MDDAKLKKNQVCFVVYSGHARIHGGDTIGYNINGEEINVSQFIRDINVENTFVIAILDCCRIVRDNEQLPQINHQISEEKNLFIFQMKAGKRAHYDLISKHSDLTRDLIEAISKSKKCWFPNPMTRMLDQENKYEMIDLTNISIPLFEDSVIDEQSFEFFGRSYASQ